MTAKERHTLAGLMAGRLEAANMLHGARDPEVVRRELIERAHTDCQVLSKEKAQRDIRRVSGLGEGVVV